LTYPPLWDAKVEKIVRAEGKNLDPQIPPAEVRMCVRCVMTNQRPRIVFDDEGVCSACRYAERKQNGSINWDARHDELADVLGEVHEDGPYNVVVPCSGGKDSAFVAHQLKHQYGMKPLCATWSPLIYTDIGRRNFDSFVHSGFDVVTATPNGLMNRKLARLGLEFYGDPFLPFIYGQLAWPMHVAKRFGIKLVFFGENGEAEYGGDPAASDRRAWSTADWERVYMKGAAVDRLMRLGSQLGAFSNDELNAMTPFYRLPIQGDQEVEFHWLGYYLPWHPQGNFYYACEHAGFEPNEERSEGTYSKYASLDDKLDGLHYWFGFLKFGIGRCTSDAAHEVRDGELTREEAVALIRRYDGEKPTKYLRNCLEYLSLDEAHLEVIEDRFRSDHLWKRTSPEAQMLLGSGRWRLKHSAYEANSDAKEQETVRGKISRQSAA